MGDTTPELIALGSTPISADKPAGEPVTYEPDFEALRLEIAKIDAVSGPPPDPRKIVELGTGLLSGKAKDLTVACYASYGLLQSKGYAGLEGGLSLLTSLISTFWEDLHPEKKRMRARVGAVTWLNERLAAAVTRRPPLASDAEPLKGATTAYKAFDAVVNEKFGSDAPTLIDLRRALEEAERQTAPAAPSPAAAAAPTPATGAAAPAQPAAPSAIETPDAAFRVLNAAGTEVRRAAHFLVQKDPASPVPYLLSRGLAWGMIKDLPPLQNGTAPFPGPDPKIAQNWIALADAGNWQGLLEDAEPRVFGSPFWLDVQHAVGRALQELGHEAAKAVVAEQTVLFVRRLPGILEFTFKGGAPFASNEARQWIAAESAAMAGGEAVTAAPPSKGGGGADPEDFGPVVRDAKSLASKRKIADALKLLQERVATARSPRERFRWRTAMAGICLDAGQSVVAAAQLEALERDIDRHSLDEWEPELSFEVLQSLYLCEKRLSQNGQKGAADAQDRIGRVYSRLCRIDVLSALALEKRK